MQNFRAELFKQKQDLPSFGFRANAGTVLPQNWASSTGQV